MSERIAICPGSFDPMTNGHLDIIRRAARLFDRVIVAVAGDAEKKHMSALEKRLIMVAAACEGLENVTAEAFDGLLVAFCNERNGIAIVKGLRTTDDISHEAQMALMNSELAPDIETVFLLSRPQNAHISSTMVRWLSELGADISGYVPARVAEQLTARQ